MKRADQMAVESNSFPQSTSMRGTSWKASSMEEAEGFIQTLDYMMATGRMVKFMDLVSISGQAMISTKATFIWPISMPLEGKHIQMEQAMRENGTMVSSMGMEFTLTQMETNMMDPTKMAKSMGLVFFTRMDKSTK